MSWKKSIVSMAIFAGLLSPALVIVSGNLFVLLASPKQQSNSPFDPPDGQGSPETTIGGASRYRIEFPRPETQEYPSPSDPGIRSPSCIPKNELPLTAVMPNLYNRGTTIAAHPTLYFYVPKNTAQKAIFRLLNEESDEIYAKTVELPENSGVLKLNIPETTALEVGQEYYWQFMLICDSIDWGQNKFVQGLIRRTELSPEMKTKLEQEKELIEQAKLYAQASIWYDALAIAADLRSEHPEAWESLLNSVGLKAIASAPFVELDEN